MTAQPSSVSRRSAPLARPRYFATAGTSARVLVREDSESQPRTPGMPGMLVFSARELQVLRLVALGRSSREIGEELVFSQRTVERHLANVYRKVNTTAIEIPVT